MSNSSELSSPLTEIQFHFAFSFAQYCSIPGACICFLVLVVCAVAACFLRSRQHLDRVSFRLVLYSLIFHVLFGIAFAAAPVSPGVRCDFFAFSSNVVLCFSTFFTTCIAINLQLVVVHHAKGQQMEKYYLIASIVLTIVLNVPAYALDQFGWDETNSVCWYKNPNRTARLHWIIATESFPILLAASVETVCSAILLVYLYSIRRSTQSFFVSFVLCSRRASRRATESNPPSHVEGQRQSAVDNVEGQRQSAMDNVEGQRQSTMDITQRPRYRKVILRIVLYPITSLLVNFIIAGLDINSTIRGVHTQLQYRLLILDLCLVGMRTLPYGLLAAFDPAVIKAVRELLGKNKSRPGAPVTERPQRPQAPSYPSPQGTADVAQTQSSLNMELTSARGERISNVVGENEQEDTVEQRVGIEKTRQELEGENLYDSDFEFSILQRQL